MKKINKFEAQAIKKSAQNVAAIVKQERKILAKMLELQTELDNAAQLREQFEKPVQSMTGGFTTDQLVKQVVTTKTNLEGKETSVVKWEFIYPETIIPVTNDAVIEEQVTADLEVASSFSENVAEGIDTTNEAFVDGPINY